MDVVHLDSASNIAASLPVTKEIAIASINTKIPTTRARNYPQQLIRSTNVFFYFLASSFIMAITKLSLLAIFLCAQTAWANNPIPDHYLTDGNGFQAAYAAAPMWYMSSGSCLPSAAEDGRGAQTNGVDPDYCNVSKLNSGCPPEPAWQGAQTYYGNIPGEPFKAVPTYYNVVHCNGDSSGGDESWRILYYLYFKKDTGHKSDWEGVVQRFIRGDGGWIRESAIMEQGKDLQHDILRRPIHPSLILVQIANSGL